MCLAVIAYQVLKHWPLVIVANRDEFHERPTSPLSVWPDQRDILAGRDLRARGTWLGASRQGRIALLTNVREPGKNNPSAKSRGQLTEHFLTGAQTVTDYTRSVEAGMTAYNGFNLVLCDPAGIWFLSNRSQGARTGQLPQALSAGVYGLSNASLDTPWPKLTRTRDAVRQSLQTASEPCIDALFEIFADQTPAPSDQMPDTGLPPERERALSRPFIVDPVYGTRSTSMILKDDSGRIRMVERSFDPFGRTSGQQDWTIDTEAGSIQYNL